MKTMNLEPVWKSMFGLAVQLVKDGLPKDKGRDFVVEMLEFGDRLNEAHEECIKNHYTHNTGRLNCMGLSTKEME